MTSGDVSAVADQLGPLARSWHQVGLGTDRLRRRLSAELGVSVTELNALAHLYDHDPSTPGQLARALGVGDAGVTTVIDNIERAGYARRTPNPADRRSRLISLNPGGRHAIEWCGQQTIDTLSAALAGLPSDQLALVTETFSALADHLLAD